MNKSEGSFELNIADEVSAMNKWVRRIGLE